MLCPERRGASAHQTTRRGTAPDACARVTRDETVVTVSARRREAPAVSFPRSRSLDRIAFGLLATSLPGTGAASSPSGVRVDRCRLAAPIPPIERNAPREHQPEDRALRRVREAQPG